MNPENAFREDKVHRILATIAVCASAAAFAAPALAVDMSLSRLGDCGTPQAPISVNQRFSDTYAYGDLKLQFVYSCYLVKHGDDYLLWDTGHSMTAPNVAPKVSIVDQLAKLDLKPDQIKYVGISHYHADHTGQVASFPKSLLLIGKGDWDRIASPDPPEGVNYKPFEGWIKGENKVEPIITDKDVFGDGSVIMLNTPGHTPGHHSLLVKLPQMGAVIITGDARTSARISILMACRGSTMIARRRSRRSSASSRSRRIPRRLCSSSTTRATSRNCRRFRPPRSRRAALGLEGERGNPASTSRRRCSRSSMSLLNELRMSAFGR
jgi:N-acyl homoserine lactone hydrolase